MKLFLYTAIMVSAAFSLYADEDSSYTSCAAQPYPITSSAGLDQYVMAHNKIKTVDGISYEMGFEVYQDGPKLGSLILLQYREGPVQPPYISLNFRAEKGPSCCPDYHYIDKAEHHAPQAIQNQGCHDCYATVYYLQCGAYRDYIPYLVFDAGNNQPLANVTVPVTAWIAGDRSGFATVGYIPEQDPGYAVTIRNEQGDLIAWAVESTPTSPTFDASWNISINSTAIASPSQADLANHKAILYALAYRFYNALPATEQCRQTCILVTERNKLIGGLVGGIGGTAAIIVGLYIAYVKSTRHYQSIQSQA